MPVSVQWDNAEKTILYVRYERWSWEDYYRALDECGILSATVNHQVYVVCDLVDNAVPKGGTITHAVATIKQDNPRVNMVVLVSSNRFVQALAQMSARVVPGFQQKYRMVNTVQAAYELIAKDVRQHPALRM